ncbi:hypothetical protein M409DRAFT_49351 [Zasmidium cellare ATCC 36951]|uniref:Uncharacterized protein n=1 Tax=Zasmidium cellare ATCC 36951 TaxID=1080233 RepID=A0A6A6D0X6_ZASCE|nr:uncharacterized protein M409DRAFT_49351 [Zasmidium cellare ATCC 36951]KAF2172825.1 hypothetical protein M409DRAFT_49351 [Zasmidium cellare ATCC 36951]
MDCIAHDDDRDEKKPTTDKEPDRKAFIYLPRPTDSQAKRTPRNKRQTGPRIIDSPRLDTRTHLPSLNSPSLVPAKSSRTTHPPPKTCIAFAMSPVHGVSTQQECFSAFQLVAVVQVTGSERNRSRNMRTRSCCHRRKDAKYLLSGPIMSVAGERQVLGRESYSLGWRRRSGIASRRDPDLVIDVKIGPSPTDQRHCLQRLPLSYTVKDGSLPPGPHATSTSLEIHKDCSLVERLSLIDATAASNKSRTNDREQRVANAHYRPLKVQKR